MEWVSDLVDKASSPYITALLLVVIVVGYILLRTGKLHIKTKAVQLGRGDIEEIERTVLRQQLQFLHISAGAMISQLPPDLDEWRTKCVIARVCDILEECALYNHIKRGDAVYVSIKQKLVYNTILEHTEKEYFRTQEFHDISDSFVQSTLNEFVNIRETYTKE